MVQWLRLRDDSGSVDPAGTAIGGLGKSIDCQDYLDDNRIRPPAAGIEGSPELGVACGKHLPLHPIPKQRCFDALPVP